MPRLLLLIAIAAVAAASGAATGQEPIEVRIDAVDSSAFPEVRATVTVVDGSGRPVADLPASAFTSHSGNRDLPVTGVSSAASEGLGIAVTLVFDVSGSMEGLPLSQAKEAGKAFVAELGPEDQVAVLAFADTVQVAQAFTSDRAALEAAIDGLYVSGNTGLYQAVADSFALARSAALPRRAVVLLSDGQDYGGLGTVSREASLESAFTAGVPLFVVGLGNLIDQPYLEDLTSAARGQLLLAPDPQALRGLYSAAGATLRHQYVVTVDASSLAGAGSATLRIDVSSGGVSASAEAPVTVPSSTPRPPVETPHSEPVRPPAVQTETSEGAGTGGPPVPLLGAAAGGFAVAAAAGTGLAVLSHRRSRRRLAADEEFVRRPAGPPPAASAPVTPAWPAADLAASPPARARLTLTTVAGDQVFALGDEPVTVGFTPECGICLPGGSGSRWERVRIWRRDGRYMLHTLSRVGEVTIGGKAVPWAVLEDGDQIRVALCTLTFHETP